MFITLNRVVLAGHSYATVLFSYRLGGQYTRARCVHSYLTIDLRTLKTKRPNGGRGAAVRPDSDCGAGGQARNRTSAAGACGTGCKPSSTAAQAVSSERGPDGGSH